MVLWKKRKRIEETCRKYDGIDAGNDLYDNVRGFIVKKESLTVPSANSIWLVCISRVGGRKCLISGMIEILRGKLLTENSGLKSGAVAVWDCVTQRLDHLFKEKKSLLTHSH